MTRAAAAAAEDVEDPSPKVWPTAKWRFFHKKVSDRGQLRTMHAGHLRPTPPDDDRDTDDTRQTAGFSMARRTQPRADTRQTRLRRRRDAEDGAVERWPAGGGKAAKTVGKAGAKSRGDPARGEVWREGVGRSSAGGDASTEVV